MFACMCVHSCLKRHAPWAIMCCPLLYLEPRSQHMDTNWALASTISAPAPVWPPSPLPPVPFLRGMFVPVAPYLHATLRRRGVSLTGETEGFSDNFSCGKGTQTWFSLFFSLSFVCLFVTPFIPECYTSLTVY